MSHLDQFKTQSPKSVMDSLDDVVVGAGQLIDKLSSGSHLSAKERETLSDFIQQMRAFLCYVRPTLERAAYSRLNEIELVRSDELRLMKNSLEQFIAIMEDRESMLRGMNNDIQEVRRAVDQFTSTTTRDQYI